MTPPAEEPPAEEPPAEEPPEEPPAEEPPAEEPPAEEPPAEEPPAEEEEEEEPPAEEEAEEEDEAEEPPAEEPPAEATLVADETSVVAGSPVILTWTATNASAVTLTANDVSVTDASLMVMDGTGGSTLTVTPTEMTVYVLTAVGIDGSTDATATVTVMVTQPGLPPMVTLVADQDSAAVNSPVVLTWSAANAESVTLMANGAIVPAPSLTVTDGAGSGTVTVQLLETTVYVLTAIGSDDAATSVSATVTVTVAQAPMSSAMIDTFEVDEDSLSGTATMVTFMVETTDAQSAHLEVQPNVGPGRRTISITLNADGANDEVRVDKVNSTTTFTLVVIGEDNLETRAQVTVEVTDEQADIDSFTASVPDVDGEVILRWMTTNAPLAAVSIMDNTGRTLTVAAADGQMPDTPTVTTTYTLTATGKNMRAVTDTVTVMVDEETEPVIPEGAFTVAPTPVLEEGTEVTLSWTGVMNATEVSIMASPGGAVSLSQGATPGAGEAMHTPDVGRTTYTLTATGPGGSNTAEVTVTVTEALAAVIDEFTATDSVNYGAEVTLSWMVKNTAMVEIVADPADPDGPIMVMDDAMSVMVQPIADTTYTLTATSMGANLRPATREAYVDVDDARPPRIVSFGGPDAAVPPNMPVALSWLTNFAKELTLTASTGESIPITQPTVALTAALPGTVNVAPLAETTYTLTATGEDGTSVSLEVTVMVEETSDGFIIRTVR